MRCGFNNVEIPRKEKRLKESMFFKDAKFRNALDCPDTLSVINLYL